ncbi:hypothetical protein HYQ46_010465 [Verticillium longisporum]|nr:hypothetical protein HYQ46_010465 [Verticillium longisporum]
MGDRLNSSMELWLCFELPGFVGSWDETALTEAEYEKGTERGEAWIIRTCSESGVLNRRDDGDMGGSQRRQSTTEGKEAA